MLKKFPSRAEFHHYIKVMIITQQIDELHDPWVMQLLNHTYLELKSGVKATSLKPDARNDLACEHCGSTFMSGQANNCERPLPDDAVQSVRTDVRGTVEVHRGDEGQLTVRDLTIDCAELSKMVKC
jgi:hypothetical protein